MVLLSTPDWPFTPDWSFADGQTFLAMVGALAIIAYSVSTKDKTVGAFAQLGGLQERQHSQRALASPPSARAQRQYDQVSYVVGVVNVCATMYLLGKWPTRFYLWHSPKAVLLITMRWFSFVSQKPAQHFLLLDFCYFANALCLLYLWVWPGSALLFQICFICSNGPLAWSVLAFNQALVFHSQPHITSVFIHVSPMLLTYGLRWHASEFAVCASGDFPSCAGGPSAHALVWQATYGFYAPWLVLYYFWVFVVLGPYIQSRGFQTLFDRVSEKGPLAPILRAIPDGTQLKLLKKAVYILSHFLFGTLTMGLAAVLFYSHHAHITFVCAIGVASAWNASTFYFEPFAKKYAEVLKREEEEAGLLAPRKGSAEGSKAE
jgi:hypothetical protein